MTIWLPISKKPQETYRNFPSRPTTTFLPERALEYHAKLNLLINSRTCLQRRPSLADREFRRLVRAGNDGAVGRRRDGTLPHREYGR